MSTPIYTADGVLLAWSIAGAARALGVSRPNVYACSEPYRDGRRLVREPGRVYVGRETLLPDGPPLASVALAARVAGVSRTALYQRGRAGAGGALVVRARKA